MTLTKRRCRAVESSDDENEEVSTNHKSNGGGIKTDEEVQLESLVFGGDYSISSKTSVASKAAKMTKNELAENLVTLKPVWKDDADENEEYVYKNIKKKTHFR